MLRADGNVLARWGGDEFVMVLPHTALTEALRVAQRLCGLLAQVEPIGEFRLTMSYGVVQREDGEDQAALLARANQALYRAKAAGKNAVHM